MLEELTLWAPFCVLEYFIPSLGRFPGLRQLRLDAESAQEVAWEMDDDWESEREFEVASWTWDDSAVLSTLLLRHLPPQLECLTLCNFKTVRIERMAAGSADNASIDDASSVNDASGASPPVLLPALTRLHISRAADVELAAPLPSLAALTIRLRAPTWRARRCCCLI